MSLLATFDESHRDLFARYAGIAPPIDSWRTPDGRKWTGRDVFKGWNQRSSDHWACLQLHEWIVTKRVEVWHIELPVALTRHSPDDPAWKFIASLGVNASEDDLEPDAHIGRADLVLGFDEQPITIVEFGGCEPSKFILNIGSPWRCDWMIVPYHCPYAFVFRAADIPLFRMPEVEDTE